MPDYSFDPARAVRFDLPSGSVNASGDTRVVLLPVEALDEVANSSAAGAVARLIGRALGVRVASRLGASPEREAGRERAVVGATLENFVTQLGGEFSVAGYGVLAVERWGRAMVIVVERCAIPEAMFSLVVASALEAATGRSDIACGALAREGGTARVLVSNEAAIARVRGWIDAGVGWGEALARLHVKRADAMTGGDA